MKAITLRGCGESNQLQLSSVAEPVIGAEEVLIEVTAVGVNRPDIMQRLGLYKAPRGASEILGLEVAGKIVRVGESVSLWSPGDTVCALTNGGGYAEFVAVPQGQCLPVPEGLDMLGAASLPETFFTVWENVFERGRLVSGESILVHGGGSGIGVAAVQMAVAWGARVYVTAGSEEKCLRCKALGALDAINYKQKDFVDVLKQLEPGGMDVILDMVAGQYMGKNVKLAAVDGRIVTIAIQGGAEVGFNYWPVVAKRLTLTGSTLRAQSNQQKANIARQLQKHIWPKIERGEIKPVIDSVFSLDEVAEAHRLMESGEHFGKIMLQVKD